MINPVDGPALVGAPVFTPQGTQLGTIDSVRVDPGSGWPRWASVQTTEGTTLIPLAHATLAAGVLQVPYAAELVRAAPRIPPPGTPPHQRRPHNSRRTTAPSTTPPPLRRSAPPATFPPPGPQPPPLSPPRPHPRRCTQPRTATRSW